MKKISRDMAAAFVNRKPYKVANTEVIFHPQVQGVSYSRVSMVLFGHVIASMDYDVTNSQRGFPKFYTTLAGHGTSTTRERLNSLLRYMRDAELIRPTDYYYQNDGEQYFGSLPVRLENLMYHHVTDKYINMLVPGAAQPVQPAPTFQELANLLI